jgi:hypothetical protein
LTDIISKALNWQFVVIYEKNGFYQTRDIIQSIIKEVLNKSFPNCQNNIDSEKINEWCFNNIAEELHKLIYSRFSNTKCNWSVSVGKSNRCYNYSMMAYYTKQEIYSFLLGSMYFELTCLEPKFFLNKCKKFQRNKSCSIRYYITFTFLASSFRTSVASFRQTCRRRCLSLGTLKRI